MPVMKLLNAGCGTHYAQGWVNCDVWENEETRPDVRVQPNAPYPFPDDTFDAIYLGHVIEHIEWSEVGNFIEDMLRIAKPDAPILIVGPDVLRTIRRWAANEEPWEMVLSTMEHQEHNRQPGSDAQFWDGATHHWNCYQERVENMLKLHNVMHIQDYTDIIPNDTNMTAWHDPSTEIVWPVVAKWYWQFALLCKKSS